MLESVSFFCPAYRDEGNLPQLIRAVSDFLPRIAARYEIIIVHDGSPDRTGQVADGLAGQYQFVRVIHHARNEGYGATLRDGFRAAHYEYVMYTDGDGQYDVTEFGSHIPLLEKADIISGYVRKKAVSRMRRIQSAVYNGFIEVLFGVGIRDINCSMKIYKKKVLEDIAIRSASAFIDAEMLIRAQRKGFIVAQFPVTHHERATGTASGSRPSVVFATIRDMFLFRFGFL
jgi:glycosyltransferase involved in cell wall biosynthesis